MAQDRHTVAVLPSPTTADVIRRQLEAAGIQADTVEVDSNFRLQVAEEDFARAMQLLFPVPDPAAGQAPSGGAGAVWFCSQCGEEVQPQSEVCWACGKPRAGLTTSSSPQPAAPVAAKSPAAVVRGPQAVATAPAGDSASRPAAPVKASPRPVDQKESANSPFLMVMLALIIIAITFIAWLAVRGS
jgi:hypothetical protein